MSIAILILLLLILTQYLLDGRDATPLPHVRARLVPAVAPATGFRAPRTLYLPNEKPDHHPCRGPANPNRSD